MFSWYKYLIVSLVFSHLGFWSGNLFLIAPFSDLCLLVPFQSDILNELAAEGAETDKIVNPDSDDSQFVKCLFNRIPEQDIESPNSCSNCLAEGNFQTCSACKYVRYCSNKCQAEDWPSHK